MLHLISQDIKAIARRTLGEILPRGDVVALAEVVHPNFVGKLPRRAAVAPTASASDVATLVGATGAA
jgi:hypothetical protein